MNEYAYNFVNSVYLELTQLSNRLTFKVHDFFLFSNCVDCLFFSFSRTNLSIAEAFASALYGFFSLHAI